MPKGILNKASLVMVPEAPIDGTMPSVFPEDRSGDFTFTRGSNLAATRVASNGLIEKGRENLLLQSNQFDTTWSAILGANLSGGQSGYDGSNDAWRFTKASGQSSRIYQNITLSPTVHTTSIYAKAGTLQYLAILEFSGPFVYFDLQNGTIGTISGSPIDVKIEEVGTTGWYRCSVTDKYDITQLRIYATDTDGSISGSGNIYIQDAQVEAGVVTTSYIESGATTGKAGLLENEPRIDFTGGGCGSLLLEPQRTNLATNSEYTGAYLKSNITATSNQVVSPEGVENATEVETTSTGQCHMRTAFTAATGNYVGSVFIKKQDFNYIYMELGGAYAWFNINDGTKGNSGFYGSDWTYINHSIEDYGNGWYRCVLVGNCLAAGVYNFRSIQPVSGNGSYNSNLSGGLTYFYGAQVEAGSYPTSYIPTYGNIVTRSVDEGNLNLLISKNIIQSDTLTYFIELNTESLVRDSLLRIINLGSANNEFFIYNNSLSESRPILYISSSTGQSTYLLPQDNLKLCIRIQPSGTQVFVNGSQVLNTTNAPEFSANSYYSFRGTNRKALFKQKAFFPTALTDEECSALTQP